MPNKCAGKPADRLGRPLHGQVGAVVLEVDAERKGGASSVPLMRGMLYFEQATALPLRFALLSAELA